MTDPTPTPHVHITSDGKRGSLAIGGQPIDMVRAFSLDYDVAHDTVPVLTLDVLATSTIYDGPAIVQVPYPVASGDAVRNLDPDRVQHAVMASGADLGSGIYATILETIATMLDEAAGQDAET